MSQYEMFAAGLLNATGNIWRVLVYRDGNRRNCERVVYVRATTAAMAEEVARKVTKRKTVSASPWNPRFETDFGRYIREVSDGEGGK